MLGGSGGSNDEHSILVQPASNSLWHTMSLVVNESKSVALHSN